MRPALAGTIFLGALLCSEVASPQTPLVTWRIEAISVEIEHDHTFLNIGQHLVLRQDISPGKSGWSMRKLDLPEGWQVDRLQLVGQAIELELSTGEVFEVNASNVGPLQSAILSQGPAALPDELLEAIWYQTARRSESAP